jgi:hypothetical protein
MREGLERQALEKKRFEREGFKGCILCLTLRNI